MDSGKKMTADQGCTKFAMLEGAPRDTIGSTVQDRRSKVQNVLPCHWMIETGYTPWHANHSGCKLFPILVGAVDSKLAIWLSTSEACACYASAHQKIMGPTIFWKVLTDQLPQPWLSLCPAVVPHFSVESCARLRGGGQSFGSSAVQRKPALQWHNHSQTQKPFSSFPSARMENQAGSLHLCLPTQWLHTLLSTFIKCLCTVFYGVIRSFTVQTKSINTQCHKRLVYRPFSWKENIFWRWFGS